MAGLWESELPFNLSCYRRDLIDDISTPLIQPCMDNGVPTWSWASNNWTCYSLWDSNRGSSFPTEKKPHLRLESKVGIIQFQCIPSATNAFGALQAGGFIELRGRVVPAVMENDAYGCASVWSEGFNPQVISLDCKTTSVTDFVGAEKFESMQRDSSPNHSKLDGTHEATMTSEAEQSPRRRNRGSVVCLLLYSTTWEDESKACILILGQVRNAGNICYQRLGLGCGQISGWSGPLYAVYKS